MHPTLAGLYPFILGSPARCTFLSYLCLYICLGSPARSRLSRSAVALTMTDTLEEAKAALAKSKDDMMLYYNCKNERMHLEPLPVPFAFVFFFSFLFAFFPGRGAGLASSSSSSFSLAVSVLLRLFTVWSVFDRPRLRFARFDLGGEAVVAGLLPRVLDLSLRSAIEDVLVGLFRKGGSRGDAVVVGEKEERNEQMLTWQRVFGARCLPRFDCYDFDRFSLYRRDRIQSVSDNAQASVQGAS